MWKLSGSVTCPRPPSSCMRQLESQLRQSVSEPVLFTVLLLSPQQGLRTLRGLKPSNYCSYPCSRTSQPCNHTHNSSGLPNQEFMPRRWSCFQKATKSDFWAHSLRVRYRGWVKLRSFTLDCKVFQQAWAQWTHLSGTTGGMLSTMEYTCVQIFQWSLDSVM